MPKKHAKYFNVQFEDLSFVKQEEIINDLIPKVKAIAEVEGKEFLKREWHDPKPQSWQEAYCRVYAIEYHNWQEYETEGVEVPQFMWETWQEESARHVAYKKAVEAFNKTEIEVIYE